MQKLTFITGNAGKANRRLGWVPQIPFETTLRDVLASFQPG